jgi:hypothetical protein
MNTFFVTRCLASTFFVSAFLLNQPTCFADEPLASIVGTGFVDMNDDFGVDIQFRDTVTAFVNADGSVRGTVVAHAQYNGLFGLGRLNTAGHVVQILIEGNEAWVCSKIYYTNNAAVVPVGYHQITWIQDLGGQRQDIMHAEFAEYLPVQVFDVNGDGIVDCQDRPRFAPTVVDQGNFIIR